MKKVIIITSVLFILSFIWMQTDQEDLASTSPDAVREGNMYYQSHAYGEALSRYLPDPETMPNDKLLLYNTAQALYALELYEPAAACYINALCNANAYLRAGNSFFYLGEKSEDAEQSLQHYAKAAQLYLEGIIQYPNDIQLKFNYEKTLEMIIQTTDQSEQENDESDQNQDGEPSDESESSENQDTQDDTENNRDDKQNSDETDKSDSNMENSDTEPQDTSDHNDEAQEPDPEAIARILKMLEDMEAESLKNNREVLMGDGDINGW